MQPSKKSLSRQPFHALAEAYLTNARGQHFASTFTPTELVQALYIRRETESLKLVDGWNPAEERRLAEKFGCGFKHGPHGTHYYNVAAAMFDNWLQDRLKEEANG